MIERLKKILEKEGIGGEQFFLDACKLSGMIQGEDVIVDGVINLLVDGFPEYEKLVEEYSNRMYEEHEEEDCLDIVYLKRFYNRFVTRFGEEKTFICTVGIVLEACFELEDPQDEPYWRYGKKWIIEEIKNNTPYLSEWMEDIVNWKKEQFIKDYDIFFFEWLTEDEVYTDMENKWIKKVPGLTKENFKELWKEMSEIFS